MSILQCALIPAERTFLTKDAAVILWVICTQTTLLRWLLSSQDFLSILVLNPTAFFIFTVSFATIIIILISSISMTLRKKKQKRNSNRWTYIDFDCISRKYASLRSFSVRAFLHCSLNNPFLQAIWMIRIFLKNSLNLARYFSAKLMSMSNTDPPRDFPFEISAESFFVSENSVHFCCRIYLE